MRRETEAILCVKASVRRGGQRAVVPQKLVSPLQENYVGRGKPVPKGQAALSLL